MSAPAFDPVVEQVRAKLLVRSQAGISKYGVTLERGDLSKLDWYRHAQEEALDFANYLQVLINEEEKAVCGDSTSRAGAPSTTPAPGKPDLSECEQLYDGVGVSLKANEPFEFTCCDCGLTHRCVIVSQDGGDIGFAVEQDAAATERRRRPISGAPAGTGAGTDRHGSDDPKDCG